MFPIGMSLSSILISAQTRGVESNSKVDVGVESVGEHVAALALLL